MNAQANDVRRLVSHLTSARSAEWPLAWPGRESPGQREATIKSSSMLVPPQCACARAGLDQFICRAYRSGGWSSCVRVRSSRGSRATQLAQCFVTAYQGDALRITTSQYVHVMSKQTEFSRLPRQRNQALDRAVAAGDSTLGLDRRLDPPSSAREPFHRRYMERHGASPDDSWYC
jgi:hypothetical protein